MVALESETIYIYHDALDHTNFLTHKVFSVVPELPSPVGHNHTTDTGSKTSVNTNAVNKNPTRS